MVRQGYYANYRGQEYHWEEEDSNKQSIYTHDVSKTDERFILCRGADGREIYRRDVQEEDLSDVYSVTVYAVGKEYIKMKVEKETEEQYFVFAICQDKVENKKVIDNYHLQKQEQGGFGGWISKEGMDLIEERRYKKYSGNPAHKGRARRGYHTIYRGEEYHWTEDMNTGQMEIITYDKSMTDETFSEYRGGDKQYGEVIFYRKCVMPDDLESVYSVSAFVLAEEGKKMLIARETEDQYFVTASSQQLIRKYGIEEWVDRGIFGTWISKEGVQIMEEWEQLRILI